MKLCTDKVVADWLALTPKRGKQLRGEFRHIALIPFSISSELWSVPRRTSFSMSAASRFALVSSA